MSDKLDETITRRAAALSKLKLTDEEVTSFTSQLQTIVTYFGKLNEINTDGIEPLMTPHGDPVDSFTILRDDDVRVFSESAKILESAPEVLHDGFKVPRIVG